MPELSNSQVSLAQQDGRFAEAFGLMRQACQTELPERVFPGAVLAVTHHGSLVALKAFGHFTYDAGSPAVEEGTLFDLASVTKVVATTSAAMLLYERGLLPLDSSVSHFLPDFAMGDAERERVTVSMLLAHSSGLPAWAGFYKRCPSRQTLLDAAMALPLACKPMSRTEYSDIGFILLGEILERVACEPLDIFCQREMFDPLGMGSTTWNPPAAAKNGIPPTMNDTEFRERVIQGEVNDENASVLGGVAGHAGLFANAADIARFAGCMLRGGVTAYGRQLFRPSTVKLFTTRQPRPEGTSRALGWDTPSQPSQSGRFFGPRSFGHLGHTGCSLWCDPKRELAIVLLSNRTWPDRANQRIKQLRPLVHDAVVRAIDPSLA